MKISRIVGLSFLIIGAFVGGGFASAKEIVVYYSQYGVAGIIFCILSGILLFYLTRMFLMLGKNNSNNYCYTAFIFGKKYNFKSILILCNFVFVASMFAGIYELGEIFKPGFGIYFQITTVILSIILLLKGIKGIEKLNMLLIPILLLSITLVVLFSYGNYSVGIAESDYFGGLINSGLYIFFNILALAVFLIEIGKYYNYDEIKKASIISTIILTSVLLVLSTFFVVYYDTMQSISLPIVLLAFNISKYIGYFLLFIVYIGMFTTLLSSAYSIKQFYASKFSDSIAAILTLIIGFVFSFFSFEKIVTKFYVLLGVVGLLFCTYVFCTKKVFVQKS